MGISCWLNLKSFFIFSGTCWKEHGSMAINCGLVRVNGWGGFWGPGWHRWLVWLSILDCFWIVCTWTLAKILQEWTFLRMHWTKSSCLQLRLYGIQLSKPKQRKIAVKSKNIYIITTITTYPIEGIVQHAHFKILMSLDPLLAPLRLRDVYKLGLSPPSTLSLHSQSLINPFSMSSVFMHRLFAVLWN